jgi:hypothetical protein
VRGWVAMRSVHCVCPTAGHRGGTAVGAPIGLVGARIAVGGGSDHGPGALWA